MGESHGGRGTGLNMGLAETEASRVLGDERILDTGSHRKRCRFKTHSSIESHPIGLELSRTLIEQIGIRLWLHGMRSGAPLAGGMESGAGSGGMFVNQVPKTRSPSAEISARPGIFARR